jgi:hypothetical protein
MAEAEPEQNSHHRQARLRCLRFEHSLVMVRAADWVSSKAEKWKEKYDNFEENRDIYLGLGRSVISFVQVVGTLGSLSMDWPEDFASISRVFNFAKLNLDVPTLACVLTDFSFYHRLLGYSLAPLIFIALCVLPYVYAHITHRKNEIKQQLLGGYFQVSQFLIFVLYPGVSHHFLYLALL